MSDPKEAIERLRADLERDTYEYPLGLTLVSRDDLCAILALVEPPLASVEAVVTWATGPAVVLHFVGDIDAEGDRALPAWPDAKVGDRLRGHFVKAV